ncbi:S41 family peptidase [Pseudozobellia thermophila]|uniref:C-terminal processing protease CtpA/Prc, contains a PDZ domain n=1 Tax=Pseudozobellia thermophila TaxID=192903 RepID=A0A1M6FFI8_9FLAO|nr:S41 family peptidase [Pseudozobellia thermophila]SHI96498.1 C-terminal processing protease CtpA/Prc, contains a PDZ domain [Pseudozobellia thermophila]
MKKFFIPLYIGTILFFVACSSDDNIIPDIEEPQEEQAAATAEDYPTQYFMWQVMNTFYFWQGDVANLADNKFSGPNDPDFIDFLASGSDPSDFFYNSLCNNHVNSVGEESAIDRFSGAVADYRDLLNSLQGISSSNGVEFNLYLANDLSSVYGVVTYIMPDSDASDKDIERGDVFTGVNGQALNINNYIDLLFGEDTSYTLNMAEFDNNNIVNNGNEVTLTKVENFSENPILINKIIEQNGLKIGYLMYNSFLAAYDDQLNEVFGTFKSENIDELILDFRYNPGGRVSSAIQIASSIYGAHTDEVFIRPRFNDKLQEQFGTPDNFTDTTFDSNTPINVLGLSRVYVITSDNTASASELVINGLEPYIDVVQIGGTTVGKNEFSNTFVDDPEGAFIYNAERESQINPDNLWGLQPLLGRNENADGFSDYTDGLVPDYLLDEDIENLGILGDENEPLLALTLSVISGETAKRSLSQPYPANYLTNSKMFRPTKDNMFMDGLLKNFN